MSGGAANDNPTMTLSRLRSIAPPPGPAYRLANARVPADLAPALGSFAGTDGFSACDIVVDGGRIALLGPPGSVPITANLPTTDLSDGIVLPRFVDVHTHLDKGHIWARASNPDGSGASARGIVLQDRESRWHADDVRTRMDFGLRCAYAHGTAAIRTHIDSLGKQATISWPVLSEMREAWKDRIEIQAVALFPAELAVDDEPQFRSIVETAARHGGHIGGSTFLGALPGKKLEVSLDRMIGLAQSLGIDLDLHVDESCAPEARSLEIIAKAAVRHGFRGRILCGHCCSLALASDEDFKRIIDQLGDAEIAIVSLPMVNMYLQDRRDGRTPRLRGVAPLLELDALGIKVMVASDNTRDPYHAYGDLDMLEVFREANRILHIDHSRRSWTRLLGAASADHMKLSYRGRIAAGQPADLILTRARTLPELLSRPQSDRVVLVNGQQIDTTLPDYRELDHLFAPSVTA